MAAVGYEIQFTRPDEFATEVELLRRNHTFLSMLDEFKKDNQTIPLEEVEKQLR